MTEIRRLYYLHNCMEIKINLKRTYKSKNIYSIIKLNIYQMIMEEKQITTLQARAKTGRVNFVGIF